MTACSRVVDNARPRNGLGVGVGMLKLAEPHRQRDNALGPVLTKLSPGAK